TPVPTPTPTSAPELLNPGFESAGANWIVTGSVGFTSGVFVTEGRQAAKMNVWSTLRPSLLQWISLAPGATYELSVDAQADIRGAGTLGVKWEHYANGPSTVLAPGGRKVRLQFTVPQGLARVAIWFQASSPTGLTGWTAVDNFKLTRLN
ncbi:MAG: hypothetical protein ACKV2V_26545, partial [Blastocatellia bacterium]